MTVAPDSVASTNGDTANTATETPIGERLKLPNREPAERMPGDSCAPGLSPGHSMPV